MSKDIRKSRDAFSMATGLAIKEAVRSNQTATDVFDEALVAFLGINRTDGRCLDIIDRHGRVSAGQLAIESGLTTGAVTAVIDRLEQAGYVRRIRDELDRRKIWVEPTEESRAITAHIFGFYARISPRLMGNYDASQIRAVLEFLEVGSYLNREMAAALREHISPDVTSVASRLDRARNVERAMGANEKRLMAEVDKLRTAADKVR